jgi:hypothetical protein
MNVIVHILLIFLLLAPLSLNSKILEVGVGKQYQTFQPALLSATAGDTILLREGIYIGNSYRENLKGTRNNWVTILAAPNENVIFRGGGAAFYLVDVEYIRIVGLQFEDQTGNSISIDDGGSYDTPTYNIVIENCTWLSMNAPAGSNMIKMAGVDSFAIISCTFLNGPTAGIGIDLVGCHNGSIYGNYFDKPGAYAIQTKGGSHDITIEGNMFINSSDRTINLGGNTGTPYFRPLDADYEAKRVNVFSNIFRGSKAPISFATATECKVINNTILNPTNWAFRILQETNDPKFVTCSNNTIQNNLIIMPTTGQPAFNIGPNTDAASFTISHNAWFNPNNPQWTPNTPTTENNRLIVDPEIQDTNGMPQLMNIVNFSGKGVPKPTHGINGISFESFDGRSIGAFSQKIHTSVFDATVDKLFASVSPNPVQNEIRFSGLLESEECSIVDVRSHIMWKGTLTNATVLSVKDYPVGIYSVVTNKNKVLARFVKIQ